VAKLLDEAVVAELESLGGVGLTKLLTLYFDESAGQVSELSAGIARGEARAVSQIAHKLKGGSSILGAVQVAQIASDLEATANAGDLTVAGELLDRLRGGLGETREAFRTRVDEPSDDGRRWSRETSAGPDAMRILVVDDEPTSRLTAQMALRDLGHRCHTASDGAQAWNAFRSSRPDVVISDWMMPRLTGVELCRKIRSDAAGGYTYFIMVTGLGAREQVVEGMSAGADDYLVKPLDPGDLQARLVAAARVTSLHRELAKQRTEVEGLNRELTAISLRDPLTGLGNRRAMAEDLDRLEARVARYGQRYCVALLDIDHFKSYNDTYGHQAGDEVLQAIGAHLQFQARRGDALYRYGGEEFLCVFPEQSLAGAAIAAERMRSGVERLAIPHADDALGVLTLSAGLAMLDPDHTRSVGEVLKEADEALYRAKDLGRNRVEHAALPTT
jgi:diguanylate cyclase (GGDEF)-like protein